MATRHLAATFRHLWIPLYAAEVQRLVVPDAALERLITQNPSAMARCGEIQ